MKHCFRFAALLAHETFLYLCAGGSICDQSLMMSQSSVRRLTISPFGDSLRLVGIVSACL